MVRALLLDLIVNIGALSGKSNWLPHSATEKGKVASHAIVKEHWEMDSWQRKKKQEVVGGVQETQCKSKCWLVGEMKEFDLDRKAFH